MKKLMSLFLICVFLSCGKPKQLGVIDYIHYIENEENGLIYSKEIADYLVKVSYQPTEYLAVKEVYLDKKALSVEQFNNLLPHYKDHYYFHMRIENKAKGNNPLMEETDGYDDYAYLYEYMSFYGQKDLKLISGKDTFECVNYHFENNYKLLPFNDIQMAFRKPDNISNSNLTLIWDDQAYGIGRLKIEFENEIINNIPQPLID